MMNLSVWWQAARPKTLPASIAPLILGNATALEHPAFSWVIAFASLCCAILLQIGVNLANDYFDFKHGVDSSKRLGPVRVTQAGLVSSAQIQKAMILVLMLAAVVGAGLVWRGGSIILLLGVASLVAAVAYSGGPYPLASHGLGELVVFLFFGLVAVGGSAYLQAGEISTETLLYGVIAGLPIAGIMLVNNTRDRATDAPAGKITLSVRFGEHFSLGLYRALVLVPHLLVLAQILVFKQSVWISGALLLAPRGWQLIRWFERAEGPEYNPLLGATAQYSLMLCLMLAVLMVI